MADWQTLSTKQIYETPWIRVHRDEVRDHNGKQLTYSFVELVNPSSFIVATNAQGQILLQQNYRYTIDKILWEIPAGYSEEEDPLAAAKRELLEEAGLASDDWIALGKIYQAVGIGNIPLTVFLARNTRQVSDKRDEDEDITNQRFFDFKDVEKMIAKGEFVASAEIACLYLAKLHGITKKET